MQRYCSWGLNFPYSRIAGFFSLTLIVATLGGCTKQLSRIPSNSAVDKAAANHPQKFSSLSVGVLPTQSRAEQERQLKLLDGYLEKMLKRQVNFQIAKDYKEVVDWLVEGKVEVAYVGVVSYLEALERKAQIEPLVAPIDKYTGRPWYRAAIIVKSESRIKTLQDLKGKRFAFVSQSSTSGYLMPMSYFKKIGINPERDFTKVIYPGTFAKTEAALEDGIVDAIATNIPSYIKRQQLGKLTPENSRILWESAPVPHSPIVISKKLPSGLIKELKRAFISAPKGKDIVGADLIGYTLVEDADYALIRQLRAGLNLNARRAK